MSQISRMNDILTTEATGRGYVSDGDQVMSHRIENRWERSGMKFMTYYEEREISGKDDAELAILARQKVDLMDADHDRTQAMG